MTRHDPVRSWREATGCPFSDGNASPMSPGSCCQIVASTFSILSYHTGISGFRKAGELGFEPRQADPESAVLPLHHSPKDFFKLGGLENSVKIKGPNWKSEEIEPRMGHG